MMERERVQKGTRERVGSAARSRFGEFAFSSSCPCSAKADFDIISTSRGSGETLRSWRHRSLTAAQAATGFTRNCVLGFSGNWYFQMRGVIRGCAECFNGTLRTSIRISHSGLPVPLLRYGERYALFMSNRARRARTSRCHCRG